MPAGVWNATRDPLHFSGAGNLIVATSTVNLLPPRLTILPLGSNYWILTVSAQPGFSYTIQGTTNLVQWTDLFTTNPITTPFQWRDPDPAVYNSRLYRVRGTR
jgi:hypothetical protein